MDSAPKIGRWRVGSLSLGAVRRLPLALIVLLALGIELRIAIWVAWDPVVANVSDELRYVIQAREGIFIDPGAPGGYAMLLRVLHFLTDEVELVVFVQHLLGIATALLVYASVRRLGAPLWAGAVAAGTVLLSGDQIFLEHALLTESTFGFLLALTLYAAVRGLEPGTELRFRGLTTRHLWIALAGLAVGVGLWVRAPAIALIPLLALWFAWAGEGGGVERLKRGAVAGGAGVAAMLVYFSLNAITGPNFGLTQDGASGWALYSRVGQFADCERFDPPAGTQVLCESSDPDTRPGPDFYGWEPGSPAVREFDHSPIGGDRLGAFAREAITSQPGDYLAAVANDSLRYFLPGITERRLLSGTDYDFIDAGYRPPDVADIHAQIRTYYPNESLDVEPAVANTLSDVQNVLRLHPALMLVALLLGIAGALARGGPTRWALVLMLAVSLILLVFPAVVAIYSARYSVPVAGLFAAAGAVGAWVLIERLRTARGATAPSPR